MNNKIFKRVIDESNYIVNTSETIRNVANVFGVSKSTVHKDVTERLYEIDTNLYSQVSSILKHHIEIKHLRGGEATKKKFLMKKRQLEL